MEQKQTAVEWLYDELLTLKFLFDNDKIEIGEYIERQLIAKQKAKEMEKQQIMYAYDDGTNERHNEPVNGEQYYNEEYGK